MEIGSWIWIFAVCTFSASAQTWEEKIEKINSTDCWNYGTNRSIFEAPGVQNFNDCGRWNESHGNPPWVVFLKTVDDRWDYGVLVSDKTIITYYGYYLHKAHKEGEKIELYAGKCEDEDDNDKQKCFEEKGLLQNKKILDLKKVKLKHGRFYSKMIFVCQIEKLDLTPNLQPACLWNWDNRNDEHEHFYGINNWHRRKLDFLPEQRCYSEEKIEKRICDLYGNSICTSKNWTPYLFIEREKRFYLRAMRTAPSHRTTRASTWQDLLPFFSEITSASVDLSSMPKIPKAKSKKDFGPN
ncbi:uncharacterized protein LOC132199538 [Neocloeon triangulifer]|uniref:uncharacterized protein LOC132199538 n=1 Tax=Neocloeon triangulifer TaxID=2078957 RepID=UPI00286EDFD1|nr:uncharacterized protein LOC132199538 [Neocloeon triangulifer]